MILKILVFLLVPVICVILLQQKVFAQVIINEVMPDPAAASDASEWVELYNAGSSEVNLTGWKLDGKTITDSSARIAANGFVVFTKNLTAFKTEFGDFPGVYEIAIGLTNSGDSITLVDLDNNTDTFVYTSSTPNHTWERSGPLCNEIVANSSGNTLLAINKAAKSECFATSQTPSDEIGPVANIQFSVDTLNWMDSIDNLGPVNLSFRAELNDDPSKYNFSWSLADGTNITSPVRLENYIGASINLHLTRQDDEWDFISKPINIVPNLQITEVMLNSSVDTWLEIYNPNDFEVTGQFGVVLNDQLFANSIIVASKDYFLINLNNASCSQNCHLQLKLGSMVLQDLDFDSMSVDQSWSLGDSQDWHNDWQITPGSVNSAKIPVIYPTSIQISEIYPSPDTSKGEQEWFELYNFGDSEIDLTGWYVSDTAKSFNLSGKISAKGYFVFMKPGISLNNGGDQISLYNPVQILMDTFSYSVTPTATSQIRQFQDYKYSPEIILSTKATPAGLNDLVIKQTSSSSSSAKSVIIKTPSSSSSSAQILGITDSDEIVSPYKLPNLLSNHLVTESNIASENSMDLMQQILPWVIVLVIGLVYLLNKLWMNREVIFRWLSECWTKVKQFRLDLVPE